MTSPLGEPRPTPAATPSAGWPEKWPVPTDAELAESAEKIIRELCGGGRWRMSIPAQPSDSDIVLAELVRRFRLRSTPDAGDAALGAALHGIEAGHPEATCQRCGGPNIVWHAPNELWNRAMPDDGIVCPLCFVVAARASGIDPIWRLAPADYSDDAMLGKALRAALAKCPPDHPLWRPTLELTPEGTAAYWTPAGTQHTDATRTLASLLSRAAQPAKEEG